MRVKTLEMDGRVRVTKVTQMWDEEIDGSLECTIDNIETNIQWVGIEPTNSTIKIAQALEIAKSQRGQYDRDYHVVNRAVALIVTDHNIRTNGKAMVSKYDGKDAITGEQFQAGTEILWSQQDGTIIG